MPDNSSNNKRIAKNTLLLYVRMLLLLGISLFTSRVVLATLGVQDYGIYNVVGGIVSMFAFVNMAMGNASARFITFALGKGDQDYLKKVFNTSVRVHIIIAILIIIVAETLGLWLLNHKMVIPPERMYAAMWVYQLSIVACVATMVYVPFNATIIAHERMGAFAYISILDAVLKLLIVYAITITSYDRLIIYAFLYLCVNILDFAIYTIYCVKNFPEVRLTKVNDKGLLKEMTSFAGWSLIGNLSCVANNQGLNILLNMFFGPAVNAARGVAYQVQSAMKGFVTNFQTAANPQITKTYANEDFSRMHNLIFATSKFSFYLLLCMALPVAICAQSILSVWLVEVPEHTATFLILILAISLIDTVERPVNTAMNATGDIKVYQIVTCSFQLLIIPLSWCVLKLQAIPEYVFIVYFAIMVGAYFIELYILHNKIALSLHKYLKEVIYRVLIVFVISVLFAYILYKLIPQTNFGITIVLMAIVFLEVWISAYFVGLSSSERCVVNSKIIKLKNKIWK